LEEPVLRNKALLSLIEKFYESSNDLYNQLIEENVCAEQARIVLPQATYTEFIETGSLFAYARIWKLRSDLHAQKEIREYASAISMIMSNLFPISWKYLTNKDESQS
jgi:thymidylate synthase (FAD)